VFVKGTGGERGGASGLFLLPLLLLLLLLLLLFLLLLLLLLLRSVVFWMLPRPEAGQFMFKKYSLLHIGSSSRRKNLVAGASGVRVDQHAPVM
jgi:hypothetical protein